MTSPPSRFAELTRIAGDVPAAKALTTAAIVFVLVAPLLRETTGPELVAGGFTGLLLLSIAVAVASRERIERPIRVPLTVSFVVLWMAASVLWSDYTGASLIALFEQAAIAIVALVICMLRDLIQIIRAVGNALRALLAVALALEVLSGLVFHVPFSALFIQGNIADGGPIQGLFVTRNLLGFVALLAVVTFTTEGVTRSVSRPVFVWSLVLGSGMIVLSQSAITVLMAVALAVATVAIILIRRAPSEVRPRIQWTLAFALAVAALIGWFVRDRLSSILDAAAEVDTRRDLWDAVREAVRISPVGGWGWAGEWLGGRAPFVGINISVGGSHNSALNAWFDVALQLGIIGVLLVAMLVLVAFGRAWVLAARRRTVSVVWPALVLVLLITSTVVESFLLLDAGWFLLTLCARQVSQRQHDSLPDRSR